MMMESEKGWENVETEEGISSTRTFARAKINLLIMGVLLLTVLLVVGTVALMVLASMDEKNANSQQFRLDSSLFVANFANVFSRASKNLLMLRTVLELSALQHSFAESRFKFSHPIPYEKWNVYVERDPEKSLYPSVLINLWVPKVKSEERAEFEAYGQHLEGNDNFTIWELAENGQMQVAGNRSFYFPMQYISPWAPNRRALDLSSEEKRKQMMELASATDKATLSDPLTLVGDERGVYLLMPVYDLRKFPSLTDRNVSSACPPSSDVEPLLCEALLGYVMTLVKIETAVVEASTSLLRNTHVVVSDLSVNEVLTEYDLCKSPSSDNLQVREAIQLNGRQWEVSLMQCEREKQSYSKYKWFVMGSAAALTVLLIVFMVMLKTNTEKSFSSENAKRRAESEREAEMRHRLLAEEERMEADAGRIRAEEILKAKAKFLDNMNRELRTPLSGVVGTIDILENNLPQEILREHSEDFETISNCAEVLLSTVNDILDINKLIAGKLKLHNSFFHIHDSVRACISTVRVAATKKNISLSIRDNPGRLKVVVSDQARLSQIVLNFLSNAVKFTPENGTITVTMSWGEAEDKFQQTSLDNGGELGVAGDELHKLLEICRLQRQEVVNEYRVRTHLEQMTLCVEDSGIGIEPAKIGAIFQPFEQADASVTRAYGGTGLGLSICRQLAQLLGGDVRAESTVGVGSKFFLSLPLDVVEPEDVANLPPGLGVGNLKKKLEMITSVSEKNLKQKRSDMFEDSASHCPKACLSTNGEHEKKVRGSENDSPNSNQIRTSSGRTPPKVKAYPNLSGKRILVVEDNILNQKVFTKYLKNAGVDVTVANNGQVGVEEAKMNKFDMIFMDCHMPVMDGYLASKHITEDEGCVNKATPIIALTADVEASNKKRCEESGMVDYLTKPLQSKTLYQKMDKYLSV